MAYHTSLYIFIFLPIVIVLYQLFPAKKRWTILLASGYVFFILISKGLIVFLLGTTLLVYTIGRILERIKHFSLQAQEGEERARRREIQAIYSKKQKRVLAIGIIVLLGVLACLKYYGFFAENMNSIFTIVHAPFSLPVKNFMLPIGISFYTLQAIGYMTDVYWDKVQAEHHLGKVALFLAFFPQIMEGPISMYSQTADQLWSGNKITGENLSRGCLRIIWGLFKKMIIADRLYVFIQAVFGDHANYHGLTVLLAAIAYTIQLYCEFSGCMDIVIGSGTIFGVHLPENFRQPFFAKNASEFWRRWHMTLGVWLKNYVFYPVSVSNLVKKWNKFGKKHLSRNLTKTVTSALTLFPVWIANGIWHGASWNYIFYGMYYFVILMMELSLEPVLSRFLTKIRLSETSKGWQIFRILKTWIIIFVGELFFRAESVKIGFQMLRSIFQEFHISDLWSGMYLKMGLDKADWIVIIGGWIVVALVGIFTEKQLIGSAGVHRFKLPVRWTVYMALFFSVIIFGAYGVGYEPVDLIYAGF